MSRDAGEGHGQGDDAGDCFHCVTGRSRKWTPRAFLAAVFMCDNNMKTFTTAGPPSSQPAHPVVCGKRFGESLCPEERFFERSFGRKGKEIKYKS
jgi:hypothetical protein